MPSFPLSLFVLAQTAGKVAEARPAEPPSWLIWLFVWGEPSFSISGAWGGLMTWTKVVGLFCLLGWVMSWVMTALKEPQALRWKVLDYAALVALLGAAASVLLSVAESSGSIRILSVAGHSLGMTLAVICGSVIFLWLEAILWSTILRLGKRGDVLVLIGLHLALLLGLTVSIVLHKAGQAPDVPFVVATAEQIIAGGRLAVTYMGLMVLTRVVFLLVPEILGLRWRRLYAIAWQCWTESFRRMWAPWIVLIVFGVILAFTSWFLLAPRPAELGRIYVMTLSFIVTLLIAVMVALLAPVSIPNDIRQQTIYTTVSKPIRRLELIWGRVLGYMALVTFLLVIFGAVSLIYFERMIGAEITKATNAVARYEKENKAEYAQKARETIEQLRTRKSARLPVKGVLSFVDSRDKATPRGIDVGQELEFRSFVEGASPSKAIWRFGALVPNPFRRGEFLNRPVPVDQLLKSGTIEALDNQILTLKDDAERARRARDQPKLPAAESTRLTNLIARNDEEAKNLSGEAAALRKQEAAFRKAGKTAEADALHSPPVKVEMTFNIYRTTKGILGEPVYASLAVINPRPGTTPYRRTFPVREYYNNKRTIPSRMLVGSHGELAIEVQCITPNQYIGMGESDLFLLADEGSFTMNFIKGWVGIWLQAMVLTAVGVCVGTFLSWPVALLSTIMFGVAGYFGFTSLQMFALQGDLLGGGPFISMIRLLAHDNQMTDLAPTTAVVVARTLDSIVMPVMSRLVYLVPNLPALDMTNTVADGFAITWSSLRGNILLAVAYALPFSIAGYFILKNREVAA
jgi:hypothetical protein